VVVYWKKPCVSRHQRRNALETHKYKSFNLRNLIRLRSNRRDNLNLSHNINSFTLIFHDTVACSGAAWESKII